jgi:hypothetical protein
MNIINVLKFIYNHPLNSDDKIKSVIKFIKWQMGIRLLKYPIIFPFTENTRLLASKGMTAATGNLYCKLMEYEDMAFLLHFLRDGDLFVDIGANVGAYTVLASGEIGADTISIEPIPSTVEILETNILINKIQDKVKILKIGLGGG